MYFVNLYASKFVNMLADPLPAGGAAIHSWKVWNRAVGCRQHPRCQ